MVIDETDLYSYVGAEDYVFAGTVKEIVRNVIPGTPDGQEDAFSVYRIKADKNLKGKYLDYCKNEEPEDGIRFLSDYDKSREQRTVTKGNKGGHPWRRYPGRNYFYSI